MNLFCFSLEGSMDSLYEVVKDSGETRVYTIPSRSGSSAELRSHSAWRTRATSGDFSQIDTSHSKKKTRRQLPHSVSENISLVRRMKQADLCTKKGKHHETNSTQRQKGLPVQVCGDAWRLQQRCNTQSHKLVMSYTEVEDVPGILKGTQKSRHDRHETQTSATTNGNSESVPGFQEDSSFSRRLLPVHERWSNPTDHLRAWTPHQHICRRPLTDYHVYMHDFTLNSVDDVQSRNNVHSSPGMVRSITSVDLQVSNDMLIKEKHQQQK